MINHLKKKLLFRYALILFSVSLLIFWGGYAAYRIISRNVITSSLRDYLQEEVFEFKQEYSELEIKPERIAVAARNNALHFFSYGFVDGQMLRLEQPAGNVGNKLTEKMQDWQGKDWQLQTVKLRDNDERWRFLALSESWADESSGKHFRVVVLLNVTPYIYVTHRYKSYGLAVVGLLCLFSLLAAKLMADNAVKPLAEAYCRQKEFISDASHELKTPLSVLMTYVEILQSQPQNKSALQVLKDECKNMSGLVESLLALSRLENNDKLPKAQEIVLADILKAIVEKLNTVHQERKNPITFSCPVSAKLKMVPQHLERLLVILLDNAIKYTPADKNINVRVVSELHRVKMAVKDEGRGISALDLPHVFERFYRADKGRNRQSGGFGLGLAMAQNIVRKYHGEITVSSREGKGSEFIIILPQ